MNKLTAMLVVLVAVGLTSALAYVGSLYWSPALGVYETLPFPSATYKLANVEMSNNASLTVAQLKVCPRDYLHSQLFCPASYRLNIRSGAREIIYTYNHKYVIEMISVEAGQYQGYPYKRVLFRFYGTPVVYNRIQTLYEGNSTNVGNCELELLDVTYDPRGTVVVYRITSGNEEVIKDVGAGRQFTVTLPGCNGYKVTPITATPGYQSNSTFAVTGITAPAVLQKPLAIARK